MNLAELGLPEPRNLIDGAWRDAGRVEDGWLHDPNTGVRLHPMPESVLPDAGTALASAHLLSQDAAWRRRPARVRAEALTRLADSLDARQEEIARADSLSSGVPLGQTRLVASYLGPRVRRAVEELFDSYDARPLPAGGRLVRQFTLPWGPALILTPWNAPSFITVSKVASAIAAGCPVILKPSEWAPVVGQLVGELVAALDLPPGGFQLVQGTGQVGAALCADPRTRVISFTGGLGAGQAIARAASTHFPQLQLELGGNNPAIVCRDADVVTTAEALAAGMLKLNGQWCEGPGKVLAHPEVLPSLVETLEEQLSTVRIGHCLDEVTELGPLAHRAHHRLLSDRIQALRERGAEIVTAGELPELGGCFLAPTLAVGSEPNVATQELFGPVVSVHGVASEEVAVQLANGDGCGLAGFVFSADHERALDIGWRMTAGEVRINGTKMADLAEGSAQSFWNSSGIGGHGPAEAARVFSGTKVVGVDDPALPF